MNLLADGLPMTAEICGKDIPIETGFRTGILFEEMLRDDAMDDAEKLRTALGLYFPGVRFGDFDAVCEAVSRLLWFYRCGEEPVEAADKAESAAEEPPFSYTHDAGYIYAAFLQVYQIDLTRNDNPLHWWQFRALFRALPEDSQIMKIIGYRTMKIPAKLPKEQKQFYRRMKRLYALPQAGDRQQLESDLSSLLMSGGNPAALLAGGNHVSRRDT